MPPNINSAKKSVHHARRSMPSDRPPNERRRGGAERVRERGSERADRGPPNKASKKMCTFILALLSLV